MPNEKKIRIPLWIYPQTQETVTEMFPKDNCKSASEFIERAIISMQDILNSRIM